MGEEYEGKMDICITESLAVHLKLTQHSKSTILQLEEKEILKAAREAGEHKLHSRD